MRWLSALRCSATLPAAALVLVLLLPGCSDALNPPGATPSPTPDAASSPEPSPVTPTATPEPTPGAASLPARCADGEEAVAERIDHLAADIEAAMEGYPGDWGFGMIDVDCDLEFQVREEYRQYAASAGKIVPVIAALRAVTPESFAPEPREGPVPMACGVHPSLGAPGEPIDFAVIEEPLLLVMTHSCDHEANLINELVTPEQVAEVLDIAGVSEQTQFEHDWRLAVMPALDLARVWAALLDGRLLDEERGEYLLELASSADIPDEYVTFPATLDVEGWRVGQKAGYCVVCEPYTLVGLGAGYLRPAEAHLAAEGQRGVAIVLMVRTLELSVADQQRREVFPLLVDYVVGDR